ncbi:MAG: sirohydrochlorin cobaltochelatase [Bacteroides sp.]|nr:sirohydrochlorin cobaltochelatase [Bacteroides sp.]
MRNIGIIIFLLCVFMSTNAQDISSLPKDKTAILMVHFGTTYDDTRALTIDAINAKAQEMFPDIKVVEAYSSRIVIARLKERGILKSTPKEALLRLAADGYTHVIVQGTNVIDGIEAEVLRKESVFMSPFFTEIRVGHPLLYSIDDCEQVVSILKTRYHNAVKNGGTVVLIGHGTSTPATAIYSQIDYMFDAEGTSSFHVATVEGYPTYDTTLKRLKTDKAKNIMLVPFMFVAGEHARNDIDEEWRERLEKEGFSVSTNIEGLGQIPEIQDIYIQHIKAALKSPMPDAATLKATYIRENL